MPQDMTPDSSNQLHNMDGIICLEGMVFLEEKVIRSDDTLVKKAFEDLYKYVSDN